jgi:DNA polymerase-3 subunit alpha
MGFCLIKDLERKTIESILHERAANGLFKSLPDFVKRVAVSLEQLRILIRIKAFRFCGRTSKELLWDAHLLLSKTKKSVPRKELFYTAPVATELPALEYSNYEDALDEMKILGFPHTSPFSIIEKQYNNVIYAKELMKHLNETVYMTGYYVNTKSVNTIHGDNMKFGTFIDSKGHLFDTVHFPDSIEAYPFDGKGCYILKGTVIVDFNVPTLDVSHMKKINWSFNTAN